LAEDGSGELIGPSASFALAPDRYAGPCGLKDVKSEFAQDREVLRAMVAPVARAILVKADIEHPVQAVFDFPVFASRFGKCLRVKRAGPWSSISEPIRPLNPAWMAPWRPLRRIE
jgi:hypothetical protein